MKKTFIFSIFVLLLSFVSIQAQAESEPNNTFASATLITNSAEVTNVSANFTDNTDVDIFKINMTTDKIYHLYSFSEETDIPGDIMVELFYESDTTLNILKGDIAGRGVNGNFRLAGWVPKEYGNGIYYLKLSLETPFAGETGNYSVRVITQDYDQWVNLHENDNTFQEAFTQFPLPIDGSRFSGMVYNKNEIDGRDDIDIFYMAGEAGKRLWVETEPVQGYPNTRDMDSKIYIYDADGNELLADNDDKSNQEEDFGNNNVFSLAVIDSLPYDGLYYVIVTSYYAAYNNDGVSRHTDEDPSTGGYIAYAWMGETKVELEPNNSADAATAICEAISGDQVGPDNNLIIDANFSAAGDVDYFAINMKTTKWYSINTANSDVTADIGVEIYKKGSTVNLIDDSVIGNYKSNDFRLSGWSPPENGVYLIKLTGPSAGDYQLRVGWATWKNISEFTEEFNNDQTADESTMVEIDSSMTYSAIYPAADEDWFWFEGNAGDVIDVELFSGLDDDGTWGRDLDTKITVIDPNGTAIENDDYRPGEERHPGNAFSAVKNYVLKGSGTVWIKVEGYYKNNDNDGKNAVGTYRLAVYSSAASPSFLEKESNDNFSNAMMLPEGKDVVSKFSSASDVDIFSIEMSSARMYFINSYESDLDASTEAELYLASDTTTNLLSVSIAGRYKNNNFRLAGYVPEVDGKYFLKLTNATPGAGKYTLRARSTALADVVDVYEPNNSNAEADALGDYPMDGAARKMALYKVGDIHNDLDVFRISGTAGQMFVAELTPVGGKTWNRDLDTKMTLKNAAGDVIDENDDFREGDDNLNTFSKIAIELPADGVYYLNVYAYYSTNNGKDPADLDEAHPGMGDYFITISGTMSESEPNNSASEANMIPIADNNLIEATFGTTDLEDWYKVSLDQNKWYYFNTSESNVSDDISVEVFAEGTTTNLIDDTPFGGFQSDDFRLCGWQPPSTGNYLLKLSIPVSAIDDQNIGTYKLRAAGGDVVADMVALHEPDNSASEADAMPKLATDSTEVLVAFNDGDHDIFAIDGTEGKKLVITTLPAHGPRWIRELDTKIKVYESDGTTSLGSNDDYDDWYELNYYLGDISNVYSQVTIDSLPYTGTYYVDAYPYYGTYNEKEPSLGKNAIGSYKIVAVSSTATGIDEERAEIPTNFGLDQNYPNPFNPSTMIQYRLKEPTQVKLIIYNILGQKVITLVNKEQVAGNYSVQWNAQNEYGAKVSTGIYFYRLVAGKKFTEVKKMILLK